MHGRFEDFDVGAGDFASTPNEPGSEAAGAQALARLGPVPWLALGLVLVLAGVLISPGPAMRDRGIVPTVSGAPSEMWSVALHSVRAADGDLWIADERVIAAAQNTIRGADLMTGAIDWESRGTTLRCVLQAPDIACVSGLGQSAELIQLTTEAGQVSRTSMPFLITAVPHADGLITLWEDVGSVTVTRWGPAGEHVWARELTTYSGPIDWQEVSVAVVRDAVLISANRPAHPGLGLAALDVEDGSPREEIVVLDQNDGEWLVEDGGEVVVYGASGGRWPVGNAQLTMAVDDEPGADVVFDLTEAALQARSRTAGNVIWEYSPEASDQALPLARLDGVLVVWSDGHLHGLDLVDGSQLWRESSPLPTCPCYAGGNVLTHVTSPDEVLLKGVDVRTGETAWRIPVGSTRSFAHANDGTHLALVTNYELTLWRLD